MRTASHPKPTSRAELNGSLLRPRLSSWRTTFAAAAWLTMAANLQPGFAAESMLPGGGNVMMGASSAAPRYIRLNDFDIPALLPPPPAPGSLAALADLDTVLAVQTFRNDEQVQWARTIEQDDVFLNREVLGEWFEPTGLPATRALFRALAADMKAVDAASKLPFKRLRPYEIDGRVSPCVARPTSSSYPSGTALQSMVWAELLAQVFPEKRPELTARAHRAAWARVIGGVHFPSDLAAGRKLVEPFLAACRQSPAFQRDWDEAKAELLAVRPK